MPSYPDDPNSGGPPGPFDLDDGATRISNSSRGQGDDGMLGPGTVVNFTYTIQQLIARGGMGEIYLAVHNDLETQHAIKVILSDLANQSGVVELFLREASVLRNIRNDAIVAYDGVFRDETGRLFLVMEYVSGPSLSDVLVDGPLPEGDALSLLNRLAAGLSAAHQNGVVHRDISPDNVILPDGILANAKIIDFGIAKLTDPTTHTIIGTRFAGKYGYASPEQLGLFGGEIDERSDIYSLGLLVGAAVTGGSLFLGASQAEIVESRKSLPDLSFVGSKLRPVLERMLQPDPADRPDTMQELLGLIKSADLRPSKESRRRGKAGGSGIDLGKQERLTDDRSERLGSVRHVAILAVLIIVVGAVAGYVWRDKFATILAGLGFSNFQGSVESADGMDDGDGTDSALNQSPGGGEGATEPELPGNDGGDQLANLTRPSSTTGLGTDAATTDMAAADLQGFFAQQECAFGVVQQGDGGLTVNGFVPTADALAAFSNRLAGYGHLPISDRVEVESWPFCEFRRLTALHTTESSATDNGINLILNKPTGQYLANEALVLYLRPPSGRAVYLTVDFIDSAGNVYHLMPSGDYPNNRFEGGEEITLGRLRGQEIYTMAEPFGQNIVLVLATTVPLFSEQLELLDTVDAYLPRLASRLQELSSQSTYGGVVSAVAKLTVSPQ